MFKEIPVTQRSITNRKPVLGVGVNDSNYVTKPSINGVQVTCPFYRVWHNMLSRCYNKKKQAKQPTYIGCAVCDDWLLFSSFKKWMKNQDWQGNQLDKDIINPGNKLYSPDNCMFVSQEINMQFRGSAINGSLDKCGVTKINGRFRAMCRTGDGLGYLGYFDTENDASKAYRKNKVKHIMILSIGKSGPLKVALVNLANLFNS